MNTSKAIETSWSRRRPFPKNDRTVLRVIGRRLLASAAGIVIALVLFADQPLAIAFGQQPVGYSGNARTALREHSLQGPAAEQRSDSAAQYIARCKPKSADIGVDGPIFLLAGPEMLVRREDSGNWGVLGRVPHVSTEHDARVNRGIGLSPDEGSLLVWSVAAPAALVDSTSGKEIPMKQELNLSIVGDWKSPRAPNTWLCYGGWRRSEDGERSALSAAFFGPDLPLAQPDVEGAVLASQDGGRSWRQMASVQGSVVVWAGLISGPAEEADAFAYLSAVGDLYFSTTQDRQLIGDLSPDHAWSKKSLGIQWDNQLKWNVYDCNLDKATVLVGSSQMGPRHAYRIDIESSREREEEWLVEAIRVPDFLAACESDSSLTLLSSVQGQEYPHRRGIELRALHVQTLEEHFSMALDWPLRWGRRATGDRYLFSVGDFLAVLGPEGSLRITR